MAEDDELLLLGIQSFSGHSGSQASLGDRARQAAFEQENPFFHSFCS